MPVKLHLQRDAHLGPDCRKATLEIREVATRPDYNPRIAKRMARRNKNLVGTYLPKLNRKARRARVQSQHYLARRQRRPERIKPAERPTVTMREQAHTIVYGDKIPRTRRLGLWLIRKLDRPLAMCVRLASRVLRLWLRIKGRGR